MVVFGSTCIVIYMKIEQVLFLKTVDSDTSVPLCPLW